MCSLIDASNSSSCRVLRYADWNVMCACSLSLSNRASYGNISIDVVAMLDATRDSFVATVTSASDLIASTVAKRVDGSRDSVRVHFQTRKTKKTATERKRDCTKSNTRRCFQSLEGI